MKKALIGIFVAPILGYIVYIISLMVLFDLKFDLKLFEVSYRILKSLTPDGIHYLKPMVFLSLFFGFFTLLITIFFSLLKGSGKGDYGKSRFANIKDLRKLDLNYEKGLILAKYKNKFIRCIEPLTSLIVAPPGTGKTASIVIPNLLTIQNSCVVLDIKGELIQKTAGYRQKILKNKVLIFSPMGKDNTMKFNPFDEKCVKNFNFVQKKRLVEEVANTLFVAEKGKDPNDFWLASAKQLFIFFALYDLCVKGKSSFGDLAQAIQKDYYEELEGDFKKECEFEEEVFDEENQQAQTIIKRDPKANTLTAFFRQVSLKEYKTEELHNTNVQEFVLVQNQARIYSTSPQETFGGFTANYMVYLNVFTNPDVAEATGSMSFDYEDLREQKITLYINIGQTDIDTLAPLVRILMESIAKNLLLRENSDPDKFIYLLLDEFIRFGKLNFIMRLPELCRSYGLIPIYITQSYQQIQVTYSKEDVDILLANTHYQVVFRMNSFKDAKEVSDTIGDFTREKESISASNMKFVENNKSVSKEGYKLLTPQDIMNQNKEKVLILVSGHKDTPLQAKRNMFFKNQQLKNASEIAYDPNHMAV
ncbi:hypothetical protein BKH41_08520 [Helicobacter sp. 12S02232-10]|uniref:type IV secretory system conjugative DNA transfer family protein n=1 Tax=Helicobacter sp. 12S02232-10 TaxID=1476197 RepID=UPI000BA7A98F|nr:type IV secretory system conjugative DNA transfer family protein [Helicobacter sp. 12S02232-10]PAF46743.1 hypothetical protein BKH41_08520 [Helicobacter sp. 12S02232-10]